MPVTNLGKWLLLKTYFQGATQPTSFKMALVSGSAAVGVSGYDTLSAEVATGNGYDAGGKTVPTGIAGFDTANGEVDATNYGYIQMADVVWTGTTGQLPSTGSGAQYAVLLNNSSQVIAYWDLTTPRTVSSGQTLTIQNAEIRITEP